MLKPSSVESTSEEIVKSGSYLGKYVPEWLSSGYKKLGLEWILGSLACNMVVNEHIEVLAAGDTISVSFQPNLFTLKPSANTSESIWTLHPTVSNFEITLSEASLDQRLKPFIIAGTLFGCSLITVFYLKKVFSAPIIPPQPHPIDEPTTDIAQQCIVCLENKRKVVFENCGHLQTCIKCSEEIKRRNNRCPSCRADIGNIRIVYE